LTDAIKILSDIVGFYQIVSVKKSTYLPPALILSNLFISDRVALKSVFQYAYQLFLILL